MVWWSVSWGGGSLDDLPYHPRRGGDGRDLWAVVGAEGRDVGAVLAAPRPCSAVPRYHSAALCRPAPELARSPAHPPHSTRVSVPPPQTANVPLSPIRPRRSVEPSASMGRGGLAGWLLGCWATPLSIRNAFGPEKHSEPHVHTYGQTLNGRTSETKPPPFPSEIVTPPVECIYPPTCKQPHFRSNHHLCATLWVFCPTPTFKQPPQIKRRPHVSKILTSGFSSQGSDF